MSYHYRCISLYGLLVPLLNRIDFNKSTLFSLKYIELTLPPSWNKMACDRKLSLFYRHRKFVGLSSILICINHELLRLNYYKLYLSCKIKSYKYLFIITVIKWNNLLSENMKSNSLQQFTKRLKKLMDIYWLGWFFYNSFVFAHAR